MKRSGRPRRKQPGAFDGALLVLLSQLRREITEPDEARAATIHDRDRPAETGRAGRTAGREGLVPARLYRLADGIGTRRQTREQIVARRVGHCGCTDRAAEPDAPTRETGPRRGCIEKHLAIDRRGPGARRGAHAGAAGTAACPPGAAAGTAAGSAAGIAAGITPAGATATRAAARAADT